jgi:branched-subunit amino acid aminotransferase/4-amino-4-deoxychorismate lyase
MKLYKISGEDIREVQFVEKEIVLRLFSGVGLFETTKILKGKPVFIREHLIRMINSAVRVWGKAPNFELLKSCAIKVSSDIELGMLRIFLVEDNLNFTIFLFTDDYPYSKSSELTVKILEYKRNPNSFSSGLKPISYFENVVLRERLKRENIDEGIFLSGDFVAEGTRSNIFWVKNGNVFTPPLSLGILGGITRMKIFEICKNISLKVFEVCEKPEDVIEAEEVFITGSVLGVGQVRKIIYNGGEKVLPTVPENLSIASAIKNELYKMELEDISRLDGISEYSFEFGSKSTKKSI